jgi:signal transduction histidine kinase
MPGLDAMRPENRTAAPAGNGSQMHGDHLATLHSEKGRSLPVSNELESTLARHVRSRPKILVVDDEPEVLRSVHNLLRIDYQVVTTESGFQALSVLREDPEICVILSDQRMPGMSGVEVLHQAEAIRPETTRLLFTAHSDIRAVIDAINQGHVFRYVAKPWEPDELETVIHQAVERRDLIVEKKRLVAELQAANAKLVEANRLKTSFLEVASHELNTPVTVVLGLTDLWSMSLGCDCKGPERQWVERIQTAALRLAKTVHRMFKLVRSNKFSQALDIETVELEPLFEQAVEALRPHLQSRGQSIVMKVEPALGAIEADASKLSDVMINLLANAIKFTPDNGTIRILGQRLEGFHDWVRVAVEDEGVGVPCGEQPHLFEPFFTGFDTLHHSSGDYQFCKRGIGLGLSLVKTFIELHGGRVDCQSAPDRGSTFEFVLPRHQPARGDHGPSGSEEDQLIGNSLPEGAPSARLSQHS